MDLKHQPDDGLLQLRRFLASGSFRSEGKQVCYRREDEEDERLHLVHDTFFNNMKMRFSLSSGQDFVVSLMCSDVTRTFFFFRIEEQRP